MKLLLILLLTFSGCQIANAYTNEEIANAIYKTEGGAHTHHPYGVMKKFNHTSPRQACMNTINSARKRWDGNGDFIVFLGKTYSPPSINPNWVRLTNYFLKKG